MPALTSKNQCTILNAILCVLCLAVTTGQAQIILRVDADAPPGGEGSTWADAFDDLQDALAVAETLARLAKLVDIWVAEGIYTPTVPDGDRKISFRLHTSVFLYGGFVGTETRRDERDFTANETILSGDLNRDDVGEVTDPSRFENSFHVITCVDVRRTAYLDGFTITAGQADADGFPHHSGGGMYNLRGSPTITNCTFIRNWANPFASFPTSSGGGAVHNLYDGQPTFSNCTFRDNTADYGGAMHNWTSRPILTDCVFMNNVSGRRGGGAITSVKNSDVTIRNCTFIDNSSAQFPGGAIRSAGGRTDVTNCVFIRNSTPSHGGGIHGWKDVLSVTNCIFSENSASRGAGLLSLESSLVLTNCSVSGNAADNYGGGVAITYGTAWLTNCIIWGNTSNLGTEQTSQVFVANGTSIISYSSVQGGWSGEGIGNISVDPLFVCAPDDDACDTIDLRLMAGSPCIDAGDNLAVPAGVFDLDGNVRFFDDPDTPDTGNPLDGSPIVDMGAYEFNGDSDGDGIPNTDDDCPIEDASGRDANADGCIDRIEEFAAVIEDLDLPDGLENALLVKINSAQAALDRGKAKAAAGVLGALINAVQAQAGKKISAEDAAMLIDFARNLLAQLP